MKPKIIDLMHYLFDFLLHILNNFGCNSATIPQYMYIWEKSGEQSWDLLILTDEVFWS